MIKTVALFNHKGGVGKTTIAYHLAYTLARAGKPTLLVDADPQCNLTQLALSAEHPQTMEELYRPGLNNNLHQALQPAFSSAGQPIVAPDCVKLQPDLELHLLPGHISLNEYETPLALAHDLSLPLPTLQNLPGAVGHTVQAAADKCRAEVIVLDLNPSLSQLNRNILTTADHLIVPATYDLFSTMALNSLARVLPQWYDWAKALETNPKRETAYYSFQSKTPNLLKIVFTKQLNGGQRPDAVQAAATLAETFPDHQNPATKTIDLDYLPEETIHSQRLHQPIFQLPPNLISNQKVQSTLSKYLEIASELLHS